MTAADTETTPLDAEPGPGAEQRGRLATMVAGVSRLAGWFAARPAAGVAVVALLAGTWAVVGSLWLFPHLSNNRDEPIYLLQADALRHGRLFPPAPEPAESFLPWLSARSGDRFITKYAPVQPALLALSGAAFGTERAAMALIAAGLVVLTYLLASEVLADRRRAALAAVFLALSPLFLIQTATFLAYSTNFLLLVGFAFCLVRGARRRSAWLLAAGGLLLGLAFFARPFDAVLFGLPLALWLVTHRRRQLRRLATDAGWLGLGAVPALLAMLAYFRTATGSLLRSPFGLLDQSDTVGFGLRKLYSTDAGLRFTPELGWQGLVGHGVLTSFYCFGGLVLLGLALVGLLRRRSGLEPWLALAGISLPLGYVAFWGYYNAVRFGSPRYLGPFYVLPVLAVLVILGAGGFSRLWAWDRKVGAVAAAGMLAASGMVMARAAGANLRLSEEDAKLYTTLDEEALGRSVVFLPQPYLFLIFAQLRNSASYDAKVLWAIDRGDEANLEVLARFPGRTPYRLRTQGAYRISPPDPSFATSIERLALVQGASLDLDVVVGDAGDASQLTLDVTTGGRRDSFVVPAGPPGAGPERVTLRVGPSTTELAGTVLARSTTPLPEVGPGALTISASITTAAGSPRYVGETSLSVGRRGSALETLVPDDTAPPGGPDAQPTLAVRPHAATP